MTSFITREYKFELNSSSSADAGGMQRKEQHTMAMRSLKKLLRPLLRIIKKKQLLRKTLTEIQQQNAYNASLEDMRTDAAARCANDDNAANEKLEQQLMAELRDSAPNAAIIVQEGAAQRLVSVQPAQRYIPVHFARTAHGTFFWTSMDMTRQQELQLRVQLDRWGQA